jgi:hypothetical protein
MSCWDCGLNKLGGINLFGKCQWYKEPKEIPPYVVDKGCKFWRSKFTQKIIEKFDGELII